MFDRDFIACGLDRDVPCEMPLSGGKRCGASASWTVPIGQAFLPCCPTHMQQALQIYRANKLQNYMFQRQLQAEQEKLEKQKKREETRLNEPNTENFRNDLFPKPPTKE